MATKIIGENMKGKNHLIFLVLILIVIFFSGCTNNNSNNNDNSFDENWLETYSPIHSVGNESNDFWIDYPAGNPNSSESVQHLPFVNDSIKKGCVLFVAHRTGCASCQPQADRVIRFAERYKDYVEFHDLDVSIGGSVEKRAYDSYLYDPDGPPGYYALTGVITLFEKNESIEYAWHSWELDVDSSELETWVRDAIYYYNLYGES